MPTHYLKPQDCLDAMEVSAIFSTLDMTSSYHQVPIKDEDIPKIAFVTKHGLYEYCCMPSLQMHLLPSKG